MGERRGIRDGRIGEGEGGRGCGGKGEGGEGKKGNGSASEQVHEEIDAPGGVNALPLLTVQAHSSTAIPDGWGPNSQSRDFGIDLSESRECSV